MNSVVIVNNMLKCTNITKIIKFIPGKEHITYL